MATVSILGCGWLGLPLAQQLLKENFTVHGSTTTPQKLTVLKQSGIQPHHIHLPESLDNPDIIPFWKTNILFLNVPPGRSSDKNISEYPSLVKRVLQKTAEYSNPWIIFASSISVYSETGGLTKEEDIKRAEPSRQSGKILLKAENILHNSPFDVTILRFGGLYGSGRHPVHHLSGRKELSGGEKPVNLVHQADCIQVIQQIIKQEKRKDVYNVVSDGHPSRKKFYQSAAKHFNLPPPSFKKPSRQDYKIVSNEKVKKDLGYSFIFPNPMDHTL